MNLIQLNQINLLDLYIFRNIRCILLTTIYFRNIFNEFAIQQ